MTKDSALEPADKRHRRPYARQGRWRRAPRTVQPPAWLASNQRILERYTSSLIGTDANPEESEAAAGGVTDALKFISDAFEGTVRDTVREDRGSP